MKKKSYCQRCDYWTNHSILFNTTTHNPDEEGPDYNQTFFVVKCDGCDTISFRIEFEELEFSYPDEKGNWIFDTKVTTYPEEKNDVKELAKSYHLPASIKIIYKEAILAYNSGCLILTGVAFRALIEAICIEKNIKGKNLQAKINNLVVRKLITEKEADRLHSIRFIGNDSIHEMKIPNHGCLSMVFKIVEHLLENLYLLDYESDWYLEKVISEYDDFEEFLDSKIKTLTLDDEVPLAKIFGRDVRRFNNTLSGFETTLIDKINKGDYQKLKIGKIDKYGSGKELVQHFIKQQPLTPPKPQ